jgi:SecD/SecF fusion protein
VRTRGNLAILALVGVLLAGSVAAAIFKSPVLGLDLRGGAEVVLQARPDKGQQVTPAIMDQAVAKLRARVDALGVSEPQIQKDGQNQISVAVAGAKHPEDVFAAVGSTGTLYFIPFEDGLTSGISRSAVSGAGGIAPKTSLYELLKGSQSLAKGNFSFLYAFKKDARHTQLAPNAISKTQDQLLLSLGVKAIPPDVEVLGVPEGKLAVYCQPTSTQGCPGSTAALPAAGKTGAKVWYMFDLPPQGQQLTGKDLTSARADFDQQGQPIVTMTFGDRGKKLFHSITRTLAQEGRAAWQQAGSPPGQQVNYVRTFAIILDGKLETNPYIDFTQNPDGIDSATSEINHVTQSEGKRIALVLQSGSLPVDLVPLSQSQVSATLGRKSLRQGLIAGIAGLAIVMTWMIVYYRFLGLIADLALLIYAGLFYALILLIPVTLTLPGIAGLILTIGVAADANVVVFERIKEEVRLGKSVRAAISGGYAKGFRTIVDANVVTLITAAVLWVSSQASVKGFAFLLGLGVLVSMFTAVAATRAMLGLLGGFRWFNNAAFMGATAKPVRWRMNFIGRYKLWFAVSAAVILAGLVSLGIRGLNQGLDFTGGTRVVVALKGGKSDTVDSVRGFVAPIAPNLGDAIVRGTGSAKNSRYTGFQIDSKELTAAQVAKVKLQFYDHYSPQAVDAFDATTISASFGREILRGAVLAFAFSIFLIVAYLAFRFDWRFALPTIAALVHDLLVTLGVYSITGREVTSATVAAVLTILGYSLYDTIIVFDRVRENEKLLRKHTYPQIVNISLWETMTRSLNTSVITLLPILSLYLFGGSTLKDFAFALLIGILSGAYSSFFIAAPLLVLLKGREPEFARRKGTDDLPASLLRGHEPVSVPAAPEPAAEEAMAGAVAERGAAPQATAPAKPKPTAADADAAARAAARARRTERRNRRR